MSRHFQLEANMTLVRLLIGVCQCQLLTKSKRYAHIYNIVTGSSVAVSLDNKFKSEVTKAAQQLKSAGSKEFGLRYSR
jgi:molybdopterin-containing oxidoreductase family iron-sulfur binding subunit